MDAKMKHLLLGLHANSDDTDTLDDEETFGSIHNLDSRVIETDLTSSDSHSDNNNEHVLLKEGEKQTRSYETTNSKQSYSQRHKADRWKVKERERKSESQQREIQSVYQELTAISDKLRSEYRILHERELAVKEREQMVIEQKIKLEATIVEEVNRRIGIKLQDHTVDVEQQASLLRERTRDNKRLKDNFDTLKNVNDSLKRELETLQSRHDILVKQQTGLQARLTNLQRLNIRNDRKQGDLHESYKNKQAVTVKESKSKSAKQFNGMFETMTVMLSWVAQIQLQYTLTEQPTKPLDLLLNQKLVQDKCIKALPSIVELLRDVSSPSSVLHANCSDTILASLQFVYWSLIHLDNAQPNQRVSLTSTLRRLGEELYRPRQVRFNESEEDAPALQVPQRIASENMKLCSHFLRSTDLHIRMLSALIILKTLTQVDLVAHVLEVLRSDLKTDDGKKYFLRYQATPVLLSFMKTTNKILLCSVVDCYLQLAMECSTLNAFLDSCTNEAWFRACSTVFRMQNAEQTVLEKLSIILQKLSKIRSNRKYFDQFAISTTSADLLRMVANDNAFLTLNLKSILFNLKPSQHLINNS